jgi:hypothetical protein
MRPTAVGLGTTTTTLAAMGSVHQLDYVERYFAGQHGLRTLEDVYMAILYPAAVGQPDTYVLFRKGTRAYTQNAGLDIDNDGVVSKFEATSGVRSLLRLGRSPGYLG